MSRAFTKDEVREQVLAHIRNVSHYWAAEQNAGTVRERCEGVAFSVLSMIDGCTDLPAFDIVVRPHPDDKQFCIEEGENYMPDGLVINDDCHMHELFCRPSAESAT